MRWAAAIGWIAEAAYPLSWFLSNPDPGAALGVLSIVVLIGAIGVLIAVDGRAGRIVAGIGTVSAAIFAFLFVAVAAGCTEFSNCGDVNWFIPVSALILTVLSFLAGREMPTQPRM
jgi:hypothetical protein